MDNIKSRSHQQCLIDDLPCAKDVFIFTEEKPSMVKMHTHSLSLDNWVLIDETYPSQVALRKDILATHLDIVYVSQEDEDTKHAKLEFVRMLVDHLLTTFPKYFTAENEQNTVIKNELTGDRVSVSGEIEDSLISVCRLTQEDWVIMQWDEQKQEYKLVAAAVLFPMRWSLRSKFGQGISGIHAPAPPFANHLVSKVNSLLKRLKPENPIWRANWTIANNLDGPLDLYNPPETQRDLTETPATVEDAGKLAFREEYQTLRKLPVSGAIVFSVRSIQRDLKAFECQPTEVIQKLISVIQDSHVDYYGYRDTAMWDKAALLFLKELLQTRQQKEQRSPRTAFIWATAAACVCLALAAR
eukprot:TRINITY_DN27075_c0_g1_i1.p1 TRINITY_DN27075_c0_g1~~TRINITY_DN27075_c0_g1_i1.p1  ORF type:complete len:382 (-),score=23.73 TRINITY_DN27075_c0_g1_i1:60-1127(-)